MPGDPIYSKIIDARTYNRLIGQHLYIRDADDEIVDLVTAFSHRKHWEARVLEVGSGPARLLQRLVRVKNAYVIGIDHDQQFVKDGQAILREEHLLSHWLQLADVMIYQSEEPFDIIVSQGFHHHVPKGVPLRTYLANVHRLLVRADLPTFNGVYIVSDEFLPHYYTEQERQLRAIIWYAHIITNALHMGYPELAREEAKTLLDDLTATDHEVSVKTEDQIATVLARVEAINESAVLGDLSVAEIYAASLNTELRRLRGFNASDDSSMSLSRGDFKISQTVFAQEVTTWFDILGVQTFGPILTIGGMCVYVLRAK
jgi:SAM-dependent methyltransferase